MTEPSAPLTYETATARLEEIIRRLDSGEAGLRETLDLVREGRELVEFCAGELDAVGQGLRGAAPRRARRAPGGQPAGDEPRASTSTCAGLPLAIDDYTLERARAARSRARSCA